MKIINKSALQEECNKMQAISERLILENLSHPFVVKLHFAFHSASKIFMLVDYVERGELFYIMRLKGKFTEDEARFFAGEIFLAIEYLHRKNIMYRDLKPENVLLGIDGHIKIADFGISKVFDTNINIRTFSMCGTP
jgi:serine/threonine protein kinase